MTKTAAIIGGGVIGGGWAARFLLMGWDVRVFDPDPEAERKIGEVLDNARRALPGLSDVMMPDEGTLSFHEHLADAVDGAVWVQESVPERLELKQKVYGALMDAIGEDTIVGSSTSGFKPSELQEGLARAGQVLVAHPFNPVYLLPVVELVPTDANPPDIRERAMGILTEIGMKPVEIKKEIDAHVADRLLEAVWREALWLVSDGIATTEEIDDIMRFGFGLRWAQMGLFETYRVAGGEAGMKHFMAQFGPALKWPWTKLMDVPEFTDELVDLIADQSDAQSGHMSIRELERSRDDNLVAMMRALKGRDWGAGRLLNDVDKRLGHAEVDISRPITTLATAIPVDWLDYNGHMTESRYLDAFARATDRFMEIIGCDADYIATGGSYFTAETHIRHLEEAHLGQRIRVETRCLYGKGKKMHLFHSMYEGERLLATGEHVLLHVSLDTRRPAPPADHIEARLVEIAMAHAKLPAPEGVGRSIKVG
ncbi:L-carnitine dehydrogenase [Aliiroseovarius sp. xm-m-379]|uniref:carnitine 3-dehydrogenase n=1 Tax=unclassified Aliiroseovarius TaxID=2623558 RepID=UPI001568DAFF|nr:MULTISPECIES: carnitine 3-dehydrogenase [unclassified Aliiroseovarius]NRP12283.1 L-carnitine dehydrogenase [Aliiroseovarius sp. xm-d-517]NRP24657.1 L-carnitine dehydrogenase [Aliiroseovarius sp. xm-m-379]NRP30709.1 L-carnitine dehydrogenase [Aliiroseovarius sp. xm-m-314]NRP33456.1 L-carnitine dehydrogenase [Aliiroseovarius sp. xm-a-104]NRP40563.1 L-carnitine dehydrogenase [Aliiroseovarius sp. xm-m-339-2]